MSDFWTFFYDGRELRDSEPQAAVLQMAEASRLAKDVGDARAALYIDHWIMQTLFSRVGDYEQAHDIAVKAVIEARQPVHFDQMERICVHEDLITAHIGIDPVGYSSLIENALEYMSKEITPDLQCRHCLLGEWIDFDLACGRLNRAFAMTQRYLSETAHIDHYQGLAHENMCDILYRRGEWAKMLNYAERGLTYLSRVPDLARHEVAMCAVKALALRKLGRDAEASTAYRLAIAKASKIRGKMPRFYYSVLCDYLLAEGNLEASLGLRDRQLAEMAGKGQIYWEAICRLERARLLKHLQRPITDEIELIRALAGKLRDPEMILKPLADLSA